ncbi:hypothetical protein [Phosphitispora sp. TUW77]|uniref:tetratricopeptide repeat protein n=1 Tax=Phosphitispora sp. TUW77 TaxID=3152361 RepID=UPI003AB11F42
MAFMNARKRNKKIIIIFVVLISVGLLGTTLPMGFSYIGEYINNDQDAVELSGSTEDIAVQNYLQGVKLMQEGKAEDASEKFASAAKGFEKVLESDPRNLPVLGDLATTYFYFGNVDKACYFAEKALEIEPKYTTVRLNYARYLFYGKNDADNAIKQIEQIAENDTYYANAQQLKQEIESMNNSRPSLSDTQP